MMESGLIVVPARGGSKRLPGKNLRRLGDKSLMAWTAHCVDRAAIGLPVLLTTDDPDIAEEGIRLGWNVPFLRPANLAQDDTTSVSTILHALDWQRDNVGGNPDFVVLLQVTSPLRGADCIRSGVSLLKAQSNADAVVGVKMLPHGVQSVFVKKNNGLLEAVSCVAPNEAFTVNGAFYAIRTAVLRSEETLFPRRTAPLVMSDARSIDIDTLHDWQVAEALLKCGQEGCYD